MSGPDGITLEPREAHLSDIFTVINGSEGEFWSEDPSDVSHKYAQYVVAPANQCLDTAGTLFKVAVLVDGGDRFVLVSSLSHILGDGHTYYVCEYTPWAR